MKREVATCPLCGFHGEFGRHKPELCARYVQMRKMYLDGMTSRQIGRQLGIDCVLVAYGLKACGVRARPRGGLNNPHGYNGRFPKPPSPSFGA